MKELMDMLASKDDMPESHKDSKMQVLSELYQMLQSILGEDVGPMEKVTVAAPDQKGLFKGLDMAQGLVSEDSEEDLEDMSAGLPLKDDEDEDEEDDY